MSHPADHVRTLGAGLPIFCWRELKLCRTGEFDKAEPLKYSRYDDCQREHDVTDS